MIRLGNAEYSGYVIENGDDVLKITLHSADRFEDIAQNITGLREVIEVNNGEETVYTITAPLSAKQVSANVYFVEFSTKPTPTQQMEKRIADQDDLIAEQAATISDLSDTVDDLLIAILEG